MKKLTGIVMMLTASMLVAGCYSKSCDTACPSNMEKVKLVDAKPVDPKEAQKAAAEAEAPPAADPVKKAGAEAEAASSAAAESAARM